MGDERVGRRRIAINCNLHIIHVTNDQLSVADMERGDNEPLPMLIRGGRFKQLMLVFTHSSIVGN